MFIKRKERAYGVKYIDAYGHTVQANNIIIYKMGGEK